MDNWAKSTLDSIAKVTMGSSPSSKAYNNEMEGLPLVQGNADIKSRITKPRTYTSEITKECQVNDIIMTVRAPVGAIAKSNVSACIGRGVCAIQPIKIDSEYLYQYLIANETRWGSLEQGSTFTAVNSKEVKKLEIKYPKELRAQQKIGIILSTVDEKIDLIDQKITKTEQLKIGLMQKLFSEGLGVQDKQGNWKPHSEFQDSRFGKISKTWRATPLLQVLDVIKDGTHFSPKSKEGPCKYLTSKNIRFGKLALGNMSYISQEEHNQIYKASPVKYGDILLTKDGANTGNAAINTLDEQFSLLSSVAYLRGSPDKVSHGYLLQILLSSKGQSMMKSAMAGQAITRLTLKKIGDFVLPFAPISEQKEIEKILSTVDEKIRLLNELKFESQQLKKGLMQKLLTGKWRFPLDDNEAA